MKTVQTIEERKVKERQDHFMAQQVEQNERVDPRDGNEIEPEMSMK